MIAGITLSTRSEERKPGSVNLTVVHDGDSSSESVPLCSKSQRASRGANESGEIQKIRECSTSFATLFRRISSPCPPPRTPFRRRCRCHMRTGWRYSSYTSPRESRPGPFLSISTSQQPSPGHWLVSYAFSPQAHAIAEF